MRRVCPFCGDEFVTTNPRKVYCRDQHQRNAHQRRYRARHTEQATCKGCGERFTRVNTSRRVQLYCTIACQYETRSEEYAKRPDIQAGMARARAARNE
jgi:hypothetical protein